MISGVIHGVIRPPVRATLSTGGGAPNNAIRINGSPLMVNGFFITVTTNG